ncbi:dTDP-4-dehydrorhamnose reductase [Hoeflea sp. CAU 1731]
MKVLVTGQTGQLASSLKERLQSEADIEAVFTGRPALDLERPDTIAPVVRDAAPDVVINAAAWTAVDAAEDEFERAMTANARAPEALAQACGDIGARLIHMSTDYVFDGNKAGAYTEDDPVNPQSVYGRSKLEGEIGVRRALPDHHIILRTAWVYSPFGRNFLKTMLALAENRDEVSVVDDQIGTPTSALDIAEAIAAILAAWRERPGAGLGRTYNCAGSGEASWAEFARHIFAASAAAGGPTARVKGIPTSAYPTKATRPKNSRLVCENLEREFGVAMPDWRVSTEETVLRLMDEVE